MIGKRVQLLKEAVPAISRLVVLRTKGDVQDFMVGSIDGRRIRAA
jgi:hypothetical protein